MQDHDESKLLLDIKRAIDDGFTQHEKREQAQFDEQIRLISKKVMVEHENSPAHRFINDLIAKELRNQERRERLQGNFVFYILIVATGAIGTAIWTTFFKK